MNKYFLTAAALGLAMAGSLGLASSPAKAGPICLSDNDSPNTYQSCTFYSIAECQATQQGVGGSCVRNPYGDDSAYGYYSAAVAVPYGSSYNRYDGPMPGDRGGYVR